MNSEKVISREYKLVLSAKYFAANESEILKKAKFFWSSLIKTIGPLVKNVNGNLDTIKTKQEIRFYDTKDFTLNTNHYIIRERKSIIDNSSEFTLKFRHLDRYISQDRNMQSSIIKGEGKTKFEEDIKASFNVLYSFSSNLEISRKKKLKKLSDILKLYPGLSDNLVDLSGDMKIFLVNNFAFKEFVITGGNLQICDSPLVNAECALIIWYDLNGTVKKPVIIEFSFRYASKKEKYNCQASKMAYDLFALIQNEMKSWIDTNQVSKTAHVFNSFVAHAKT